jgi:hypothetical protein
MTEYNEKLVESLIGMVENFRFKIGESLSCEDLHIMKATAAALKPKPAKFCMIPEWCGIANVEGVTTYCKDYSGEYGSASFMGGVGFTKDQYNAIREATAIDADKLKEKSITGDELRQFYLSTVVDTRRCDLWDQIAGYINAKLALKP